MSNIYIHALKICENIDYFECLKEFLGILSPEKLERITNTSCARTKNHLLLGDFLLRYELKKNYNIFNHDIEFYKNSYGKPFLKKSNIFFNISHSGNWVVVAMDTISLGIDIQEKCEIDYQLAEKFLNKNEIKVLNQLPLKQKKASFFDLWSYKESYLKALGKGLSVSLESFEVKDFRRLPRIIDEHTKDEYYLKAIGIDPDYSCSLCSKRDVKKIKLFKSMDIDSLKNSFIDDNNLN